MLKAAYFMNEPLFNHVYQESTQEILNSIADFDLPLLTSDTYTGHKDQLKEIDVLFTGWGAPVFDAELLDLMPQLKVIFYAAGSMKAVLTDEVWKRGIRVTTASVANSIPVAEFVLGEILFSLKNGFQLSQKVRRDKTFVNGVLQPIKGIYQTTVGIISMSSIGTRVAELLQPFDVNLLSYDPYVTQEEVNHLNVQMCSLAELFSESDVVSLHTPLLPETKGMITGELLHSLKEGATFINTARGAIVDEPAMIDVLENRPDLMALLDVTDPEPPVETSPLYTLPNVVLTPHIAGSVGNEKARLGDLMLEEYKRYSKDGTLAHEITQEAYRTMA